jgi:hypothetical protein
MGVRAPDGRPNTAAPVRCSVCWSEILGFLFGLVTARLAYVGPLGPRMRYLGGSGKPPVVSGASRHSDQPAIGILVGSAPLSLNLAEHLRRMEPIRARHILSP